MKGTANHCAFWLKPVSIFGLFLVTTFISSSLTLTLLSEPGTVSV
jgi:hypothetical protein